MAAGDRLLDASGNVILDSIGNVQFSDGAGDGCCCGPTYNCFKCSNCCMPDSGFYDVSASITYRDFDPAFWGATLGAVEDVAARVTAFCATASRLSFTKVVSFGTTKLPAETFDSLTVEGDLQYYLYATFGYDCSAGAIYFQQGGNVYNLSYTDTIAGIPPRTEVGVVSSDGGNSITSSRCCGHSTTHTHTATAYSYDLVASISVPYNKCCNSGGFCYHQDQHCSDNTCVDAP